jgi:hypothetical protein
LTFIILKKKSTNEASYVKIQDNSLNGTYINGVKIGYGKFLNLRTYDVISLSKPENYLFTFINSSRNDIPGSRKINTNNIIQNTDNNIEENYIDDLMMKAYRYIGKCFSNRTKKRETIILKCMCKLCEIVTKDSSLLVKFIDKNYQSNTISCFCENIIYLVECKKCSLKYIGQTKNTCEQRLLKHINMIKNDSYNSKNLFHDHFAHNCNLEDFSFNILMQCENEIDETFLLLLESIYISLENTNFPSGLNHQLSITINSKFNSNVIPTVETDDIVESVVKSILEWKKNYISNQKACETKIIEIKEIIAKNKILDPEIMIEYLTPLPIVKVATILYQPKPHWSNFLTYFIH